MEKILSYLIVLVIFLEGFALKNLVLVDIKLSYLIFVLSFLILIINVKKIYLNKSFVLVLFIIIFSSIYNILLGNNTSILLIKQLIGIIFTSLVFVLLIKINKFKVKKIFKYYLNIAFIVAGIGVLQEISFLINFKYGYDFSWIIPNWRLSEMGNFLRVNSILAEPAHFGIVLIPAFFISVHSFIGKDEKGMLSKWKSVIIITSLIFTFSGTTYIGMLVSIIILFYNMRKAKYIIIGILITILIGSLLYFNVIAFQRRVNDTFKVLSGEIKLENTNLSTFTLLTNGLIAYKSFNDNPLFGSGLGSHVKSYNKYIDEIVDISEKNILLLNKEDANSLFLRLFSEIGLFGILVFAYFILNNHIMKSKNMIGELWVINNSILALFMVKLLRSGHYFANGFLLFVWMYYFTKKVGREKVEFNKE